MKKLFIIQLIACCTFPLWASSQEPTKKEGKAAETIKVAPEIIDVSGYYTCKGSETGGKKYAGLVSIVKKDEIHIVQWILPNSPTFTGVGIVHGKTFCVSWAINSDKGMLRGVNVYRIEPGKMTGLWATLPGPGKQQRETLTFLKKMETPDDE